MTSYEKSLRLGTWAIVCALVLRLGSEGVFGKAVSFLKSEEVRSFVIYLETGRRVRSLPASERFDYPPESAPAETVPEETTEPPATQPTKEALVFGPADTVSLYNTSGLEADTAALLEKDISFPDLTGPKVLIYSTHTTESYTQRGEDYEESAPYRTLDERYNMLSLGALLEGELENRGIEVLRDETLHDYPSYNAAYSHARKAVTQYLKDNPSLALVIDLHRDARETPPWCCASTVIRASAAAKRSKMRRLSSVEPSSTASSSKSRNVWVHSVESIFCRCLSSL